MVTQSRKRYDSLRKNWGKKKLDIEWKFWTKEYRNRPFHKAEGVFLIYVGVFLLIMNMIHTQDYGDVTRILLENIINFCCIVIGSGFLIFGIWNQRKAQKKRRKLEERLAATPYYYGRITGVFYEIVHPETSIDETGDDSHLESYVTIVYHDDEGNVMSTVSDSYFGDLAAYLSCDKVKVYQCMDDEGKPILELPWRQSKDAPFISFEQYKYTLSQRNQIYWMVRNEEKLLYGVFLFAGLLFTVSSLVKG